MTKKVTNFRTSIQRISNVDRQINENLKRAFDEKADEAIPDHLSTLLEQLKLRDGKKAEPDDST